MRSASSIAFVVVALFWSACGETTHTVTVRIVSDVTSGAEAKRLSASLYRGPSDVDGEREARIGLDLTHQTPLERGLVAARFENVTAGTHAFSVDLLSAVGARIVRGRVVADVHADTTITIFATADCANVMCPGDNGNLALTACVHGTCVDPRCSAERRDLCPAEVLCARDDDCGEQTASCAEARCVEGICIDVPNEQDCASSEYCARDIGCAPLDMPTLPGGPDARCGTICLFDALPCTYGFYRCDATTTEPACVTLSQRPTGAPCGDGQVCNASAMCTVEAPIDAGIDASQPTNQDAAIDASVDASIDANADAFISIEMDASENSDQSVASLDAEAESVDSSLDLAIPADANRDDSVAIADSALPDAALPDAALPSGLIVFSEERVIVTEFGQNIVEVGVTLAHAPAGAVSIRLQASDATEAILVDDSNATLAQATLLFDASTWSTPQSIFVRGVDDEVNDYDGLSVIGINAVETADDEFAFDVLRNDVLQVLTVDDEGVQRITRTFGRYAEIESAVAYYSNAFNVSSDGRFVLMPVYRLDQRCGDTVSFIVHDRANYTYDDIALSPTGQCPARPVPDTGINLFGTAEMSADGRYVAYNSGAANLVDGDTNGFWDVFVFDREARTTELISTRDDGSLPPSGSNLRSFSDDGRYVCFSAYDSGFTSDPDSNGTEDIFLRDLVNENTILVSRSTTGTTGNGTSLGETVASTGGFVGNDSASLFFLTDATDLTASGYGHVWLRYDVVAATLELVPGHGGLNRLSGNGAFDFEAISLLVDDTFRSYKIYRYGVNAADGAPLEGIFVYDNSYLNFSPSFDGGSVLVTPDNFVVLLYEVDSGSISIVSRAFESGGIANGQSNSPHLSRDERWAVFRSTSTNLTPDTEVPRTNNGDVFVAKLW